MPVDSFSFNQIGKFSEINGQERSCLYPLEPWGVGSSDVESLTSYVARLATTHQVPTGVLLGLVVAPIVSQLTDNDSPRVSHSFWRTFGTDSGAWNGTGMMAFNSIQALQTLTLRHNLHCLTLLTWNQVLAYRGLVRSNKAWCPACYEEWVENGIVLHEPLLWSLKIVTVCPRHRIRLQHQCPYCYRSLYWLEWNSRPGYCSRCHQWLGEVASLRIQTPEFSNESLEDAELVWQTFVIDRVGELLEGAANLRFPPRRENIARGVNLCIKAVTGGNAKAFADIFCYSASVPGDWRRGKAIPQLHLLLRLCYCLGISLFKFLIGEVVIDRPINLMPLPANQMIRKKNRPFDSVQVQTLLESTLKQPDPKSLRQVALEIGYDPGDLSRYFPDLCHAISQRYKRLRGFGRKPSNRSFDS